VNRVEIARQYVEELLDQRQDIIAAWIGGSVARGEETELSDIDLSLMVAGTGIMDRAGLDHWREGIYIEANLVFQQGYVDLEMVLNDPFKATHMNDALILYDPTEFVTQLQNAVRPVYMQSQWLGKRLNFWLQIMRTTLDQFREAVSAADALRICAALGLFVFSCSSVPLLRAGITPSSTRSLLLLGSIDPKFKEELAELEDSAQMNAEQVLALEPLLQEASPLWVASYGQLPIYFVQKMVWMARQGHHQEALHTMWVHMGVGGAQGCLDRNIPAELVVGTDLMQRWLHRLGMHEPSILVAKIQDAEMLLQQAEVLVNEIN
jgi:predicted nucleotidyltransferase